MTPDPNVRGSGMTRHQIENAPQGALFVWINSQLDYPKTMAIAVGREDVRIVSLTVLSHLNVHMFQGCTFPAVILDHAIRLTDQQSECYDMLCGYTAPREP